MLAIKFLAAVAAVVSAAWVYKDPGFKSVLSLIGSISALISAFVVQNRRGRPSQHQVVSGGSKGIQAGGDVLMGNVESKKNVD